MGTFKSILREPLAHFLLIGALFFLFYYLNEQPQNQPANQIVVTSEHIAQMQAQFKRTWMRSPTQEELNGLIDSFVEDEVYYREALELGLDQNDPQVRRRMRLKLQFILEDLSDIVTADDQTLTAFLENNADMFLLEPRFSFYQVYINPVRHQDPENEVKRLLDLLSGGAQPDLLGDSTMLNHNYQSVHPRDIARSFGRVFAENVSTLPPGRWSGPIHSSLGIHLVYIYDFQPGRQPGLDEIRSQVEREYMAQRREEILAQAYRALRDKYEVVLASPLPGETDTLSAPAAEGKKE